MFQTSIEQVSHPIVVYHLSLLCEVRLTHLQVQVHKITGSKHENIHVPYVYSLMPPPHCLHLSTDGGRRLLNWSENYTPPVSSLGSQDTPRFYHAAMAMR